MIICQYKRQGLTDFAQNDIILSNKRGGNDYEMLNKQRWKQSTRRIGAIRTR
jgi:hypothetical protein